MKSKIFFILFVIFINSKNNYGQLDTLINYNVESNQIFDYPQTIIDSSKIFDNTNWNIGSEVGFSLFNTKPPDSTYNNSGFSDFRPVQNFYPVNNFPIRTAVKLFINENDTLKQKCSGILVAYNYVLTDCHCVGIYDTNRTLVFYDSVWTYPAFDNGNENPVFGKSLGIEYITFKSNLQGFYKKDIVLIKLKEGIGTKTGWVGIAFSKDDSYYVNKVLHKLSYPGTVDPVDSTRIFNGDTLYYNYGTLDLIDDLSIGYNITGIPGQSGSSLFYTNNEEYYSLGTQVWSAFSRHIRITPEIFYAFKPIIKNGIAGNDDLIDIISDYYLSEAYPNPFNPKTKINYFIPNSGLVLLKLYDILGKEIQTLVNEVQNKGEHIININGQDLSSGVYFCRIQSNDFFATKKIILLK